jgi:hypothetical protein
MFPVVSGVPFVVEIEHEFLAYTGSRSIQLLLRTTCADCLKEIRQKLNANEFGLKIFPNIFEIMGIIWRSKRIQYR